MVIAYEVDTSKIVYKKDDKTHRTPCYNVSYINTSKADKTEHSACDPKNEKLKSTVYGGVKKDKITPRAPSQPLAFQVVSDLVANARHERYLRDKSGKKDPDRKRKPKNYKLVPSDFNYDDVKIKYGNNKEKGKLPPVPELPSETINYRVAKRSKFYDDDDDADYSDDFITKPAPKPKDQAVKDKIKALFSKKPKKETSQFSNDSQILKTLSKQQRQSKNNIIDMNDGLMREEQREN